MTGWMDPGSQLRQQQAVRSVEPMANSRSGRRRITVAAVQAEMRFYPREADFREQMAACVREAMKHEPDLLVFPEDIATGLVAINAPLLSRARSLRSAMLTVALYDPWVAVRAAFSRTLSLSRALLLAAAPRVRNAFVATFSELARSHQVHICAGSVLLPHEDTPRAAVYNTCFLFGPDGSVLGTTDKVNLIPLEGPAGFDLTPGRRENISVWRTAIGNLGALVCLDAWDVELAARLVEEGAQLLIVPAANPVPWTPEEEAARRQGLYARVRELGVPGVEAFGVGRLAGLDFEGRSWILTPDPDEPDGVRVVARTPDATTAGVVVGAVELPAR